MSFMNVVEGKYAMKNGISDTLFGLIGETKGHTMIRSLGGIVDGGKPDAAKPSGIKKVTDATEHVIGGKNATKIPGAHYGMILFPGAFMARRGPKL